MRGRGQARAHVGPAGRWYDGWYDELCESHGTETRLLFLVFSKGYFRKGTLLFSERFFISFRFARRRVHKALCTLPTARNNATCETSRKKDVRDEKPFCSRRHPPVGEQISNFFPRRLFLFVFADGGFFFVGTRFDRQSERLAYLRPAYLRTCITCPEPPNPDPCKYPTPNPTPNPHSNPTPRIRRRWWFACAGVR